VWAGNTPASRGAGRSGRRAEELEEAVGGHWEAHARPGADEDKRGSGGGDDSESDCTIRERGGGFGSGGGERRGMGLL
jgi:hypothetical protein